MLLTLLLDLPEESERAWRDSWHTLLLSLFWKRSREFHYSTTTAILQPDTFHVYFVVLCNAAMHEARIQKRGNGLLGPGPVKDKKSWEKTEEKYLSRMNSAISFCICFPFSCFCSKTSNPVTQLLLWASLLSFCNVSNKSNGKCNDIDLIREKLAWKGLGELPTLLK